MICQCYTGVVNKCWQQVGNTHLYDTLAIIVTGLGVAVVLLAIAVLLPWRRN